MSAAHNFLSADKYGITTNKESTMIERENIKGILNADGIDITNKIECVVKHVFIL